MTQMGKTRKKVYKKQNKN